MEPPIKNILSIVVIINSNGAAWRGNVHDSAGLVTFIGIGHHGTLAAGYVLGLINTRNSDPVEISTYI